MDFLDKLILGKNTPRHSENVQYPSRVYKKPVCKKKHCTQACTEEKEIWEYWATFLATQPVDKKKALDKIKYLKDQLRFGVWMKLIENDWNIKIEECAKTELGKEEIDCIIERDKFLLGCVISKYRDKNEEQIFKILRKIVDTRNVENFVLLVDFTYLVTELPNCTAELLDKLMTVLFTKYKFDEVFKEEEKDNLNIKKFENLVYKEYFNLYKIIDKLLCYNTTLSCVLEKYPSNGPIDLADQEIQPVYCKEETYFDFLMVQNENIKAQEIIKKEQIELQKRNDELENIIKKLTSTDKE
jgi:hypothetical protein